MEKWQTKEHNKRQWSSVSRSETLQGNKSFENVFFSECWVTCFNFGNVYFTSLYRSHNLGVIKEATPKAVTVMCHYTHKWGGLIGLISGPSHRDGFW